MTMSSGEVGFMVHSTLLRLLLLLLLSLLSIDSSQRGRTVHGTEDDLPEDGLAFPSTGSLAWGAWSSTFRGIRIRALPLQASGG